MAAMPLLRQDHDIHQVGHSAAQPVAQAADPVADLVAENEVTLIGASPLRPAASSSCSMSSEYQAAKSPSCSISRMVSSPMVPALIGGLLSLVRNTGATWPVPL